MHTLPNRPAPPRPDRQRGFTLIEIMIVVLIIGILLAIAVPNFISARESSRARSCVANLSQINSAKMQCVMDNKLGSTSAATFSVDGVTPTTGGQGGTYQLTAGAGGSPNYLRAVPVCPDSGVYATGSVNANPTCSIGTNPAYSADYHAGGRWYHGF